MTIRVSKQNYGVAMGPTSLRVTKINYGVAMGPTSFRVTKINYGVVVDTATPENFGRRRQLIFT